MWREKNILGIVVAGRGNLVGCRFMNILIENGETLEYLTDTGAWTKNPRSGKKFATRETALHAARLETIGKFNIVWHIPVSNQLVNLDHGRGKGLPETAAT